VNEATKPAAAETPRSPSGDLAPEQHQRAHHHHHGLEGDTDLALTSRSRSGWAGARDTAVAALGAALGLLPHLLHHVSLFAGALVITGAAGNLLFATLGLLLSVPLLRRLYRRFTTWKAPALALAVFAVMFSFSAFVLGPALAGNDSDPAPTAPSSETTEPTNPSPSVDHDAHHGD
jgi:hypothetical protein